MPSAPEALCEAIRDALGCDGVTIDVTADGVVAWPYQDHGGAQVSMLEVVEGHPTVMQALRALLATEA